MSPPEWDNPVEMEGEPRRLRADAERNRRHLIRAATEMFCERGLDVGVGEIAHQAGVGRGTLFRHFPSKEHLIAAVVVERINDSIHRGREALRSRDAADALFELIDSSLDRQQTDRALFDALADTWMANPGIRAAHREMLAVLEALLARAQQSGAVRDDVSAIDVLMLVKGVCSAAREFQHVAPDVGMRQLDLIRAAISTERPARALRGRPPTLEDLEWATPCPPAAETVAPAAAVVAPAPAVVTTG